MIAADLRKDGISALVAPSRGLRSQMKYADHLGATHALVIGEDEVREGTVTVRDLSAAEQWVVARGLLAGDLRGRLQGAAADPADVVGEGV